MKTRDITKRKFKFTKVSRDAITNDFTPFAILILVILAPIALLILSRGFRDWVIGIIAKIVDVLVLSNLFVFNLVVILVIILLIIAAIYIYRRL